VNFGFPASPADRRVNRIPAKSAQIAGSLSFAYLVAPRGIHPVDFRLVQCAVSMTRSTTLLQSLHGSNAYDGRNGRELFMYDEFRRDTASGHRRTCKAMTIRSRTASQSKTLHVAIRLHPPLFLARARPTAIGGKGHLRSHRLRRIRLLAMCRVSHSGTSFPTICHAVIVTLFSAVTIRAGWIR
jgi:hypothetical protein